MIVNRSKVGLPSKSRSLDGQNVLRFDNTTYSSPGCSLFILGEPKSAAGHMKNVALVLNKKRENSTGVGVMFACIAKNIIFLTMSVKV